MPGCLRVRLAVTIGVLACTLVACGTDEGGTGTPPTSGSETGAEATPGTATGGDPSAGPAQSTGAGASCDPSTSTTPETEVTPTGTAPGDSQTHTQNPADNCVIDSGIPNTPVDP